MLAEGSPPVLASTEKPLASDPSSNALKGLGETVLVEEVVVPEDCPPDGGLRAWLVVFGISCGMGAMIGIVNSWGTWQAYYEEGMLQTKSSSEIAWIGSVQNSMSYAPGLVVGRMFDLGYFKLPVFASSVLFVVCMFLTAECKEYWQFLLCQGFGIGIAGGVFFNMGTMVLTHWFKRRLGLALAMAYCGTSVCGCIFPIVIKNLLQHVSFQWTVRILGFITLVLLVATNLTATRRLPGSKDLGPLINVSYFKKPVYSVYVASLVINDLALYAAATYITVSAANANAGLGINFSYDLPAIINGMTALGQFGGGWLADRYDPLTVITCSTLLAAAVTYAWPFAANVAAFVVVAVIIGISTGGFYSSMVQPFERMGRPVDVGLRIGMGFTIVTVGVVAGAPLSGAIFDHTGLYKNVGYYGGSMLALSAGLMVATKHFMVRFESVYEAPGERGRPHPEPALL